MPTPTIYFVRHGETDWNAEGRLQGQRDIPLNEVGRSQAGAVAEHLRALVGSCDGLDYVASPLRRARETMELMRGAMGLDPAAYRLDDRLKEIAYGRWEGMTWKEIRASAPAAAAERDQDRWRYAAPDGESYEVVARRVRPLLNELEHDTVMVAHGGIARALLTLHGGWPLEAAAEAPIWQGQVLLFQAGCAGWVPGAPEPSLA